MSAQTQNGHVEGEICEHCQPIVVALGDTNRGLEETIRKQAHAIGVLRRVTDPEKRAREHELWDVAKRLFDLWRRKTGHTRSKFDASRFNMIRPFVETDGVELCVRAIEGIAYDPFEKRRRNGTMKRFDDWKNAFEDRGRFEEACNRAPFDAETLEEDIAEVEARH